MNIGPYKVTYRLGAGGMGVVFRVTDDAGRPFAIKMIGSHSAIHATLQLEKALQSPAALHLGRRMLLVREATLATNLSHPNIVRTFDYGQHGGLSEALQIEALVRYKPRAFVVGETVHSSV